MGYVPDVIETNVSEPDAPSSPLVESSPVDVTLFIRTSSVDFAGTESGASVSFLVGGNYTNEVTLMKQAAISSNVTWRARLSAWPSKVRFNGTEDRWIVNSVELRSDKMNSTLLNATDAADAKTISSTAAVELEIPALRSAPPPACVTRDEPRVTSNFYETSPSGSLCIFGLDDRDEGNHCVYDDGKYGTYGWCYTDDARSSWGACSENCPLQGQAQILGGKIDEVLEKLDKAAEKHDTILNKLTTTTEAPAAENTEVKDTAAHASNATADEAADAAPTTADAANATASGANTTANATGATGANTTANATGSSGAKKEEAKNEDEEEKKAEESGHGH